MLRLAWLVLFLAASIAGAQNPIHWSLRMLSKGPVLPGQPVDAGLTATIDKGWHLYTLTPVDSGPQPTLITALPGSFTLVSEVSAPAGIRAYDDNFDRETEFFEKSVTFAMPLMVEPGTANGHHPLDVMATWQTCNDRLCLPPTDAVVTLDIDVGAPVVVAATPVVAPTSTVVMHTDAGIAPSAATIGLVSDMASASRASTLGAYIGLAMLMGALSLATPCVFPMVPITVSYFTSNTRRRRRDAAWLALMYGLGIVLTFTGLGLLLAIAFGASGLTRFAADPWLNLAVTAMFVAFALSLFGVHEATLPSRLLTAVSATGAARGPVVGTMLMGLAFTLTSFTCTAPFLGTLLVVASRGEWRWPLMGMLAFSSVFALPFVILALVPQAIVSLPRSGPWLTAVKAVMGILELAAAMKFLSNVDLVWGWHTITRSVVLASWVVLAAVLIAYLAGVTRLGAAPRLSRPGRVRLAALTGTIIFAGWLVAGLSGRRLGELEAFLPPADSSFLAATGELPWIVNDYPAALARAGGTAGGQPILIDFTGYTCTNCRWMEANMFPRPEVARELSRYVRVRLYTDGRGEPYRGFQRMEQRLFGTVALPYYAVMTADGAPIVGFSGLTRNPAEYLAFLRRGIGIVDPAHARHRPSGARRDRRRLRIFHMQ